MDEMMRGQRGWRELAVLGDKMEKLSGMLEGLIWSPRSSEANDRVDDWAFEEVTNKITICFSRIHAACFSNLFYFFTSMLERFQCMELCWKLVKFHLKHEM